MNESAKQILTAVLSAAAATTVAVVITNYFTKKSTLADVASGKTPLPPGSTPTTNGPPIVATPQTQPQPQPPPQQPQPAPVNLLNVASQISQGISMQPAIPKCPPGYHAVPTGQPNFPYMCILN